MPWVIDMYVPPVTAPLEPICPPTMMVPDLLALTVAAVDVRSRFCEELLFEEPDDDVELVDASWLEPLVLGVPCANAVSGVNETPTNSERAVHTRAARLFDE